MTEDVDVYDQPEIVLYKKRKARQRQVAKHVEKKKK